MTHNPRLALLHDDRFVRNGAISRLENDTSAAYALRQILLRDPDATLRATAAKALGAHPLAEPWLVEASEDPAPLVREAAFASLARLACPSAIDRATHACLEDEVWWVRRSAVFALARMAGAASIGPLRQVLDDPFWRVRYAAIQCLHLLGTDDVSLQQQMTGASTSTKTESAALEYLQRQWGAHGTALTPEYPVERTDETWDPDPAVMAARLEAPNAEVNAAHLIEMLADPHQHLRLGAVKRLSAAADERVLRAALIWLEEPRIPYAAQTTREMLNRLGTVAATLVAQILSDDQAGVGARQWALQWVAKTGSDEFRQQVRDQAGHQDARIRRATLLCLEKLRISEDDTTLLIAGLEDADPGVRGAAVYAIGRARISALHGAVEGLDYRQQPTALRRLLLEVAIAQKSWITITLAGTDSDPQCRAAAVSELARANRLTPVQAMAAWHDLDPWIRIAVVTEFAADFLEKDNDASVRRAAISWLVTNQDSLAEPERLRLGTIAANAGDQWLRASACRLLDAECAMPSLLSLSRDGHASVRLAADQALLANESLNAALHSLLATDAEPGIRIAAYSYLCRDFDEMAAQTLRQGLATESAPEVTRHLRALAITMPDEWVAGIKTEVAMPVATIMDTAARARTQGPRRLLGKTGIEISPLVVSGAHELSKADLDHGWQAGVNSFFWEPRYRALTRFIRELGPARPHSVIIGGTYESTYKTIRRDVETALRRLGTDYLDVFLLFWVRSRARVNEEAFDAMQRLKDSGKVRAIGFSTHHRDIACEAIKARPWDLLMLRHNAAHTGAEREVFPTAVESRTGILTFSNLCYGRMLKRNPAGERPTAADCYRYSLSQPSVCAAISAPRRFRELEENLGVLKSQELSPQQLQALREHGQWVYGQNKDFNALVRRTPREAIISSSDEILELLELGDRDHV